MKKQERKTKRTKGLADYYINNPQLFVDNNDTKAEYEEVVNKLKNKDSK